MAKKGVSLETLICDDCYTGKRCDKPYWFHPLYCKKFLVEDLGENVEDVIND